VTAFDRRDPGVPAPQFPLSPPAHAGHLRQRAFSLPTSQSSGYTHAQIDATTPRPVGHVPSFSRSRPAQEAPSHIVKPVTHRPQVPGRSGQRRRHPSVFPPPQAPRSHTGPASRVLGGHGPYLDKPHGTSLPQNTDRGARRQTLPQAHRPAPTQDGTRSVGRSARHTLRTPKHPTCQQPPIVNPRWMYTPTQIARGLRVPPGGVSRRCPKFRGYPPSPIQLETPSAHQGTPKPWQETACRGPLTPRLPPPSSTFPAGSGLEGAPQTRAASCNAA
jgi:hypothetical protein